MNKIFNMLNENTQRKISITFNSFHIFFNATNRNGIDARKKS